MRISITGPEYYTLPTNRLHPWLDKVFAKYDGKLTLVGHWRSRIEKEIKSYAELKGVPIVELPFQRDADAEASKTLSLMYLVEQNVDLYYIFWDGLESRVAYFIDYCVSLKKRVVIQRL